MHFCDEGSCLDTRIQLQRGKSSLTVCYNCLLSQAISVRLLAVSIRSLSRFFKKELLIQSFIIRLDQGLRGRNLARKYRVLSRLWLESHGHNLGTSNRRCFLSRKHIMYFILKDTYQFVLIEVWRLQQKLERCWCCV